MLHKIKNLKLKNVQLLNTSARYDYFGYKKASHSTLMRQTYVITVIALTTVCLILSNCECSQKFTNETGYEVDIVEYSDTLAEKPAFLKKCQNEVHDYTFCKGLWLIKEK